MKYEDLIREVKDAGGTHVRNRGDHTIWKLPNGLVASIPNSGKHSDIGRIVLAKVRRALRGIR